MLFQRQSCYDHAGGQDPTASGPVDYHSGQGGGSLAGGTDGSEADPPASDTGHNGNSNGYGSDSFCCDNNNDGTGAFNPNPNSRVSGNSYSKANSRFTGTRLPLLPLMLNFIAGSSCVCGM